MQIPEFPKLKVLELSDRQEIERTTCQFQPYSDFHFPILWSWDIHQPVMLSNLHGNLVISQPDCLTGKSFCSLIGCNEVSRAINILGKSLKWVPEETFQAANGHADLFKEDPTSQDYIYDVTRLHLAQGGEYEDYRMRLNRFKREQAEVETRFLDLSDYNTQSKLIDLFLRWSESKNETGYFEFQAFRKLLLSAPYFQSLAIVALQLQDELIGFAILDQMTVEYSCIPFMKSNINYKFSMQFLMKEVAAYLFNQGIKYINFEPDMGIPSLQLSKRSYRPSGFLKKYSLEIV